MIWNFIQRFVRDHDHVPDISTIRENFQRGNEIEIVDRLETVLSPIKPRIRGDFQKRLQDKLQDRQKRDWEEILKEAAAISTSGVTLTEGGKERHLKGAVDAALYVQEKTSQLIRPAGLPAETDVTRMASVIVEDYRRRKQGQRKGVTTGLRQIDQVMLGLRKGQLWIHSGFTGGYKSGFAIWWAYFAAAFLQRSSIYYSLEMAADELRDMIVSMHSAHAKFSQLHKDLGVSCVPYAALLDGDLTPAQETLLEVASHDLKTMVPLRIVKPVGELHLRALWDHAESIAAAEPIDMVIIDHMGLLDPLPGSGRDEWQRVNANAKLARRMAQEFKQGQGIGLLALHQINREGGKRVLTTSEKGGKIPRYDLTHMAGGSEIERSAYVVTSSYVDDRCRAEKVILIDCLKGRLKGTFPPFLAGVDWDSRRLRWIEDEAEANPLRIFGSDEDKAVDPDPLHEDEDLAALLED